MGRPRGHHCDQDRVVGDREWLFRAKTGRKIFGTLVAIVILAAALIAGLGRFECELPAGAWKAPLHALAHLMDSRCQQKLPEAPR